MFDASWHGPTGNSRSVKRSIHSPQAPVPTSAVLAETLGFHFVMIADHVAITPDVSGRYPAPFFDPFITLAWLAGETKRVELGTTVIVLPYRNPILTARLTANIDQISGGRFIFGVGIGWAQQEFAAVGADYHRRGAVTDECLEAIKTLWTQNPASYEGRHIAFQDIDLSPMPVRSPHPPIWVGGASPAALRRTVKYGDGWHPIRIRVDQLRDVGLPALRETAERLERPVPALCPRIRLGLTDSPLPEETRLAREGSVDQVRSDLAALEELGAEYVLLDTWGDDLAETTLYERTFAQYSTVAEKIADLPHETVR